MRFEEKIDVIEEDIDHYSHQLLDVLLKDRTTDKNIIWGTNDYEENGPMYSETEEIYPELVIGVHSKLIQPRVAKAIEQQSNRTRAKAEVFTPSWICNQQNNLIDDQWFGRENVFNYPQDDLWMVNPEKIEFSDELGHRWQDYVDACRMEIACGEAPYLVSRYDTVTGKSIDLIARIGLLDRKLRVVNENVTDEREWLKWAFRAIESTYGFEYQGDNLLLARENILYTFIDNLRFVLKREPKMVELRKVANIISWNIWQMDALTYAPPLCDVQEDNEQLSFSSFFEVNEEQEHHNKASKCKIRDWRSRVTIEYYSLVGED